ncbi:phage integrase family protein [Bordetella sp. 02P26C-1]|uniref:phage integrase family protein n=1 Tax=Bordetella sp. 02P26C-1 TaxID=2683195 RepID=UPI001355D401|nr:phage integrase family protein [Bordetella sp. 02P26C-1]MVW77665.1 tyrosine-type recombinase/integrase [Bordetella sp. 02P26C-1]
MDEEYVPYRSNRDHLEFYRAWMEGTFNVDQLANRYLETGTDRAAAKRILKAVQATLVTAARRMGKHGQARLLMLDRDRLREADARSYNRVPSERRRRERDARLFRRRLTLIAELIDSVSVPPKPGDLTDKWFDESVAKPLMDAGLRTIAQVAERANATGYLWYKSVPRLGPTRAARLNDWFKRHNEALGDLFTPFALTPKRLLPKEQRQPWTSAAVSRAPYGVEPRSPFLASRDGFYLPPAELDGSRGRNRAPLEENRSGAANDYEAIQAWLNLYKEPQHKHTLRAYRTSAERLLLWCVFAKQKALSSLTTQDVLEYKAFLADPKPYDLWVSDAMHPRYDPDWRPFIWRRRPKAQRFHIPNRAIEPPNARVNAAGEPLIAGLSADSVKYALTVAAKLCTWLVGQRYLDYNPFSGLARKKARTQINVGRSLTRQQWDYVMQFAASLPDDSLKTLRLRFVLHFAFSTGLRLSELVNAKAADISIQDLGDDMRPMVLHVVGKGQEPREVFLPQSLQRTLAQYLSARGLPDDPRACPPETPLIAKLYSTRWGDAMTDSALYRVLTNFFESAANAIPDAQTSVRGRENRYRLLQASTHWLRHTHGSHAAARGTSLAVIQQNLGHKSLTTTSVYVKAEARLRAEQMEAFDQAVFGQKDA